MISPSTRARASRRAWAREGEKILGKIIINKPQREGGVSS